MGLIYVDSCVLVYAVEEDPVHGARTARALAASTGELSVSPLVKLECLAKPLREGNVALVRRYEAVFAQATTLPLDEQVFEDAAHLRARFGLRTPDALHLACAQRHGCTALWTHDARLARASGGLAMDVLRE